jgi:sarcosine oxidase subunit delta
MSFLLPCPNCGSRSVYEFRFGGELKQTPFVDAPVEEWQKYRFQRANVAGVQTEWWFHRSGCRQWILTVRNTISNDVLESFFPGEQHP